MVERGYAYKRRGKRSLKKSFISVVIPVYNDPKGIKLTLESLLSQDYPSSLYEIIAVDNNSTDNTRSVVKEFSKKYPRRVKLLVERDIQSSYAARNKGISASKGEIIAFVDSDMWVDKRWFGEISKSFSGKRVEYVGFNVRVKSGGTSLTGMYNELTGFPIKTYISEDHFSPTNCLAVKKDLFKKVGLFDPKLISSGDLEFGVRIWKKGFKQDFIEEVFLHHPPRKSLRSLVKKEFRIGRGNFQLVRNYPGKFGNLRRNFRNVGFFLPPNPLKFFRKKVRSSRGFFLKEYVGLYLIGFLMKITSNFGYFYESFVERKK